MQWMIPLLVGVWSAASHAETVKLTLPNKLVATAEFRQGAPGKPAVFLLHGFLQTHSSPTIHRLTDSLAGEGYTVLAPTLSLGVPHRKQSLACEAINTHTLAAGVEEIHAWLEWLKVNNMKIILAGHSLGNAYNLAYLSSHANPHVRKLIGVSIVEGRLKMGETARRHLLQELRQQARGDPRGILENQFSYCQKFRSSHASILSYLEWGPDKVLTEIDKGNIPITMIMGGKDDLLGPDWLNRLKKTRAKVLIIEGAGHFMEGPHEFDLLDAFLAELKGI